MTDTLDYYDEWMEWEREEYMQEELRREWEAEQEREYIAYMEEQERLYYEEFGYDDPELPEDSTRYAEEEDWSEDDFPR